ncbi:MAG: DNA starvation/stationary phase protection protein Dps [Cyanomargarita calcarea GSE-NOS-MK-12-04C]|jgi:starvation-inducible DNA-binding protein|uniref:DNA starvation/stationary phase protection protein Dps n=1 Tax=Cyanomargarita calcarea GSE-NOS-MK-12-04C TaxID=2839659 RepID=A0A951QI96_9CYAN|nr:DNA starvation/stationary phase protection protein Dps [Cyanomargarita calcarea GSE-NOS-MK-12-04C]
MNGSRKLCPYPTRIDIPVEVRADMIDVLNWTLATAVDLKTQVKQAHWNLKGINFYQPSELFNNIAAKIEQHIDLIAQRITILGGRAMGTSRTAARHSTLPEYPLDITDDKEHMAALAERLAIYAKYLRENIDLCFTLGDANTANLYTEISRRIDKYLWFLESQLATLELK